MSLSSYTAVVESFSEIEDNQIMSLVYISSISEATKKTRSIFEYVEESATKNNRTNKIQGFLCNSENYFIQCLEGTKRSLLVLMADVFKDKQLSKVKIILAKSIKYCRFNDWTMYGDCLEKESENKIGYQLQEFIPFNPTYWQDWQVEHFIEMVDTSVKSPTDNRRYITYPYKDDNNFFIYLLITYVSLYLLLMIV